MRNLARARSMTSVACMYACMDQFFVKTYSFLGKKKQKKYWCFDTMLLTKWTIIKNVEYEGICKNRSEKLNLNY